MSNYDLLRGRERVYDGRGENGG